MLNAELQVLWFKRDLRLHDHAALRAASAHPEPVLPVYVHEPSRLQRPDSAQQHRNFVLETLAELQAELQRQGGALWEQVGEVVDVLEALWQQTRFHRLWAHQETTHAQDFARDRAVHAWCRTRGVEFNEVPHSGVRRGAAFREKGFDFRAHLQAEWLAEHPLARVKWAPLPSTSVSHAEVPLARGADKPLRQRGGRPAAESALTAFFEASKVLSYPTAISTPNRAPEGCSRMSAYLAYGVVSDGELFRAIRRVQAEVAPSLLAADAEALKDACRFYIERLYWRSSYLQRFELDMSCESRVELSQFQNLRELEHVEEWFEAWKLGRTGYPLVDAGMRYLAAHGWVNMRLRGLLASFALNDLWLDWRQVNTHLALEFLDYEPAIHNSQVAIHSGSSKMSGPLIYDAVKQAQDHDADGRFVRQWVPELGCLQPSELFEPWALTGSQLKARGLQLGQAYPFPLVPAGARTAAKERVTALREGAAPPRAAWWKERAKRVQLLRQSSLL